jgi:hypothetical protein
VVLVGELRLCFETGVGLADTWGWLIYLLISVNINAILH